MSRALADLPMLEAELEDGSLQYSHVKELTRIVTPETEDEWIEAARGKTCGEVQAMVAGHKKGDGPEDPDQPDLRLRWLTLGLSPQTVVMYRELIVALEAELGHRLEEAEAFRMIIERAKACSDGASTPAQISICSHCDRGWQEGAGGRAELEPAAIATASCDAEHMGPIDGAPARKTRTLTDRKRTRIIARDHHRCALPGCRSKKHLDVHHRASGRWRRARGLQPHHARATIVRITTAGSRSMASRQIGSALHGRTARVTEARTGIMPTWARSSIERTRNQQRRHTSVTRRSSCRHATRLSGCDGELGSRGLRWRRLVLISARRSGSSS